MAMGKIVVSIDVGTTKICVLIAQVIGDNQFDIIGIGRSPSDGLKKGVVVDVAKTVNSIKNAIQEAELMAGLKIETASVGISGGHIHSINSNGVVPIKHGQVKEYDINNVLAAAKAVPIEQGQQILHVLPQYFIIDGKDRVSDPLGMHGIRLEVQAHLILGSISSVQNLVKCCEAAGVSVCDIILEQLASADAVLSEDERQLGVAVLDIGGGTSDLALYQQGSIRHTMVLPLAGTHFTNDLAVGLHTTLKEAERVKKQHGLCYAPLLETDETIEIEAIHGGQKNMIQLSKTTQILQARATEIFSLIHQEITKHHLEPFMRTGLVLTGGGSLLAGSQQLAEAIFKVPVRIGSPRITASNQKTLENPIYATGYGLLIQMLKKEQIPAMQNMSGPLINRIFLRMKSWVSDFF